MADLSTGTNQGICSVRKLGSQWVQPRTLSYNPAERAVIVTSVRLSSGDVCLSSLTSSTQTTENGQYELVTLPKTSGATAGDGKETPSDGKKGAGGCAIFVARNRLAVLDKTGQVSIYLSLRSTGADVEHRTSRFETCQTI